MRNGKRRGVFPRDAIESPLGLAKCRRPPKPVRRETAASGPGDSPRRTCGLLRSRHQAVISDRDLRAFLGGGGSMPRRVVVLGEIGRWPPARFRGAGVLRAAAVNGG